MLKVGAARAGKDLTPLSASSERRQSRSAMADSRMISVHLAHPDTPMQNLAADSILVDMETDLNTKVGSAALVGGNPIVMMQARL